MIIRLSKKMFCNNTFRYISLVRNTNNKVIISNKGKDKLILSTFNSQKQVSKETINKIRNKFKGTLNCENITETILPSL